MSISGVKNRCCAALAVVSALASAGTVAFAGGHGEKIEFSEPSTPVVASNLTANLNPTVNRLNPNPSAFKQVEEDLFGPLKNSMQPADSMQGVMTLPLPGPQQQQPRQVLSKHAKELLDQRRNWAFTDLNDLYPDPTLEEALGVKQFGPDGKEQEPVSLIQRYIERKDDKLSQKNNLHPGQKDANADSWDGRPVNYGLNSINPNGTSLPVAQPVRKNPFAPDSDDSDKSVATFRASNMQRDPEDTLMAQKHREEFSRLLDPSLPASKPATTPLFGNVDQTGFNSLLTKSDASHDNNAQSAQQSRRNVVNPVTGLADPNANALYSHVYQDPTATALGQPTVPKPVAVTPRPKTAESVQKMLDPFGAALGKPRF